MNSMLYKRKRQKPHILMLGQCQELGRIAGNRSSKSVTDQGGIFPSNLFRLRKKKLELIYLYLMDHNLIHDKELALEPLQAYQLAEYLLHTIYPGYSTAKAKNQAYTEYRFCREKDTVASIPLAYDIVPTTEVYERLDEMLCVDVNWPEEIDTGKKWIEISMTTIKKAIERIRTNYNNKPEENIEYHLYFWNSTKTLIKPQCRNLIFNSKSVWDQKKEKMVTEGFMHVNITKDLKDCLVRPCSQNPLRPTAAEEEEEVIVTTTDTMETLLPIETKGKRLKMEIELFDKNELNIRHISIAAVMKKTTDELVGDLYLQATTECISKSIQNSRHPLDTQQIVVHLLRQYHNQNTTLLENAENLYITCLNNKMVDYNTTEDFSTSEDEYDSCIESESVSLIDPLSATKIQHPIKSLHCRHRTCFDAIAFFQHNANIKLWHCPICSVHVKNMEELRINYTTKIALNTYPDQNELFVYKDTLLSEHELFGQATSHLLGGLNKKNHHKEVHLLNYESDKENAYVEANSTTAKTEKDHYRAHKRQRQFITHVM